MEFTETFILPIITALIGGLAVYFVIEKINKSKKPQINQNLSKYSGRWYGLHYTRKDPSGELTLSQHEYDLKITRSGKISGNTTDSIKSPPINFEINGLLSGAGLVLIMEGDFRPGYYAAQFHPSLKLNEINIGIISSFDVNNVPFSSPIVLSRSTLSKSDLLKATDKIRKHFYVK
jgi:hypothetical protein